MEKIKNYLKKIFFVMFEYNIFIFLIYINTSIIFIYQLSSIKENLLATLSVLTSNIFLIVGTYTLNKISDKNEDTLNGYYQDNEHRNYNIKLPYLCLSLFFLSFLLYAFLNNDVITISWFIMFLLAILYSYPRKFRLKNIFLIKNITSAFCWFFSIALLLIANNTALSLIHAMKIVFPIFLLVFIIEIIWDMPDITGDKKGGIKTLPVIIGFSVTRIIILILLVLIFLVANTPLSKTLCLILFIFTLSISKNTKKYIYHSFIFFITLLLSLTYFIN